VAGQVPATGLPVGTVLVYNAHIDQSLWSYVRTGIGSPDALFQVIANTLWMKWDLTVVHTDYGELATVLTNAPTPIAITVNMTGPKTYGQPADVARIIDGEIADALGGSYLTDSNISTWTIPKSAGGSGAVIDTGNPAASTSAAGEVLAAAGIDPGAISDAISNAVKNATSGLGAGTGIIVIVLGLAIVAAVLVAVAPTSGARAFHAFRSGGRRR
jgi:hypothetical protein